MQNKEIGGEKSVNEKNVEVFNRYFPGCLSIENDNKLTLNVERLKALLGDFSEIKEEGYGLDFVGKKIALNEAFKKNNKILKPLNKSTSKHILIKGDNLDALKILKQSYSEKIKMIYIDPPYNTKKYNFIYSDDFSQSNEEVLKTLDYSKEKLDYIKNLFGSKCHSGWLSFMYPRLLLARDLLKQDGVIFISIDDNECAQLKLLCDEIFGERNFVACCPVVSNRGGRDYGGIAITHEYILIYQKEFEEKSLNLLVETDKKFQYEDKNGFFNLMELRNRNIKFNSKNRPNLYYPFYVDLSKVDENNLYDISLENKKGFVEVYPLKSQGINTVWRWGKEKALKYLNLEIKAKKKQDGNFMIVQKYRSVLKRQRSIFDDVSFVTEKGSNAVKDLFNGVKVFDYPKSPFFIKRLIEISSSLEIGENENDIILDFFAGSGTTAHAVLESNKSDYQKLSEGGGGLFNGLNAAFKERRFILVQLDEKIDPKNDKSTYDFCLNTLKSTSPSIFDITEERIKRAGAKIKEACPNLDVGFRAFEIIDDETHANDKNLSQAHQKDLFAYSNPEKMETQTILIKLLGCEGLELTTPIICLIENALYLAENTAFIVGDIEMSEVLENLKDKGVEKISMYMPAISNDRLCLELGSNLLDLKLESGDLKIRG
ncbi:site-specific DNA-methyltransferase [Helicobacter pylori]|nr:site-specific DNA-methyltransferase [Helicobacter pylori]